MAKVLIGKEPVGVGHSCPIRYRAAAPMAPPAARSCLVQIDVGVDLHARGVCAFGGVWVVHWRDLHTWTGSQAKGHREGFR